MKFKKNQKKNEKLKINKLKLLLGLAEEGKPPSYEIYNTLDEGLLKYNYQNCKNTLINETINKNSLLNQLPSELVKQIGIYLEPEVKKI